MHVLSLPFGFAVPLLPRQEARLVRSDRRPIRVLRGPNHRERIHADVTGMTYRRPIA